MIHSFLLIGQSNMAGRGDLGEAPDKLSDRIVVLRNGRWQPIFRPVNPDRPFSGYCLAETFAEDYAEKHEGVTVGLIPCADGGTSLDQWMPGNLLFDHAVMQTRLAMRTSDLAGILWHQGEGDCDPALCPLYENKMQRIMGAFRHEFDAYSVPFLLGALGDFLPNCPYDPSLANYGKINEALIRLAQSNDFTQFVPADGLTSKPDFLHFDTKSLMEFGHRYYTAFEKSEDRSRIFKEKPITPHNKMESL